MEGVIRIPLAPIRSEPSDRAELVTQALFGEQVRVQPLDGQPDWSSIVLEQDGYEGFIDPKLVDVSPDAVSAFRGKSHVLIAPLTSVEWGNRRLHLPAGSRIPEVAMPEWNADAPSDVVEAAMQFLGAPYLWGGKSILGIDCSGLTQLAGRLCGMVIPRDAGQQWSRAELKKTEFDQLRRGDLVFFHKEGNIAVTHVGLAVRSADQGWQVIHASGEVRIDDLTPEGIRKQGHLTHLWTGIAPWPVSVG